MGRFKNILISFLRVKVQTAAALANSLSFSKAAWGTSNKIIFIFLPEQLYVAKAIATQRFKSQCWHEQLRVSDIETVYVTRH